MAEELNKDAGATFYDIRSMNRWFLGSVAVLTIAYLGSVWDDHDRDWKASQVAFAEIERGLAVGQGQRAFEAAGGTRVLPGYDRAGKQVPGSLLGEIERLQTVLASDRARRPALVLEFTAKELAFNVKNAAMKAAKATFEADRFAFEELAHEAERAEQAAHAAETGTGTNGHGANADDLREHATELKEEVHEAALRFAGLKAAYEKADEESKSAEAVRDFAKAELARNDALVEDVRTQLDLKEREVNRLEKRADSVDPDRFFNKFRNSIFVNFMAPTVAPRKIVVKEILDDLNFLDVPKVDMCITCHLATDRNKDYLAGNARVAYDAAARAELLPEFRSHSKPELFTTSLSPHNQERFGCSGCHAGGNQRLGFATTFHTPTDAAERADWEERLHWHPVHEWEYPMLGSRFIDASCYKCHQEQVHIPGADKWNHGRDLVAKYGCFGCHKMAPFEGSRKVGPPLDHVVSKFSDLDWMLKWVSDPKGFRPSTRMPAFFHLDNRRTDDEDPERQNAEITALVSYLYTLATPVPLAKYPGNGDAARGKQIFGGDFGGYGCLACHSIDDFKPVVEESRVGDLRHGPELSGIGSKVTADWLYTWIRDPEKMWPDTNMPNLRLTDQEAADIVAYLMTKRNPAFEAQEFKKPEKDALYEEILKEKLTERMTGARADGEIKAMTGLEKRRKAGEYLMNHYGCFGCHNVPGYEDAKPIGTELNGWGSKHPDRLDFGLVEMEWKHEGKFTRHDWLDQKLRNTRFYDHGKDKKPFEKLKMPAFSFAEDEGEREAVMTFVMSLVKSNVLSSIERHLTPSEQAVERGRRIVREKNCFGCHILYGEGGELREFQGEPGAAYYPPILDGQGARTQPDWLFKFLADPVLGAGDGAKAHLRPWMKARMPTFGFTQEELNDVVAYFAHEEVWQTSVNRPLWNEVAAKFAKDFPDYGERKLRNAPAGMQQLFQSLVARQYRRMGGQFLHETDWPYLADVGAALPDAELALARGLFERLQCLLCHAPGGKVPAGKSEADMAPDLRYSRERLAPRWTYHWFDNPLIYQPGTRMTKFWDFVQGKRITQDPDGINDGERELTLIRDYLFSPTFDRDYVDLAKRVLGN